MEKLKMKLHKRLEQYKFVVGCVDTNNGNYEQHARITMWRLGSNTYKIVVEEFDMPNELDCEKYICGKRKAQIIWSNLCLKYSELQEVHYADPY